MKIAGYQMQSMTGDVEANLDKIAKAAARAAEQGARLLIAPELAINGYGAAEALVETAVSAQSPTMARLSEMAARTGLTIVAGFAESDGDAIYNSAVLTDGSGEFAVYRKSHLYGPYERRWFSVEEPRTILADVDGMRVGMLICYDVEFPENVRRLAKAGVDLVVVPTALPIGWSGSFIAEHMIRVRAFENQVFVAYINHCGADRNFAYAGRSHIAAPDGSLLAEAPADEEALFFAEIVTSAFDQSRAENTYLRDLR
ncbi:carbon-nitrogen hydrolase family protein [Pseudorhizobium flavum]|uniref:Putative amidohydrolase n=1 Tax=Pseudorhizobium flavum TaxID=1335061 RepID=A0A7X0DF40_9HYPH|nr:carbon-nitrogen hydrolase family protein [Pseudorhizobium flavum]MBB6181746.1 putative amidohydrolase [Pseudorhizobium flavum]CAD6616311.1 hydrolase [Pseudorhizobium flavum]